MVLGVQGFAIIQLMGSQGQIKMLISSKLSQACGAAANFCYLLKAESLQQHHCPGWT